MTDDIKLLDLLWLQFESVRDTPDALVYFDGEIGSKYADAISTVCHQLEEAKAIIGDLRRELLATFHKGSPAGEWIKTEVFARETKPLRDRIQELEAERDGEKARADAHMGEELRQSEEKLKLRRDLDAMRARLDKGMLLFSDSEARAAAATIRALQADVTRLNRVLDETPHGIAIRENAKLRRDLDAMRAERDDWAQRFIAKREELLADIATLRLDLEAAQERLDLQRNWLLTAQAERNDTQAEVERLRADVARWQESDMGAYKRAERAEALARELAGLLGRMAGSEDAFKACDWDLYDEARAALARAQQR